MIRNYDAFSTTAGEACDMPDRIHVLLKDENGRAVGVSRAHFTRLVDGRVKVELRANKYPDPFTVEPDYEIDVRLVR